MKTDSEPLFPLLSISRLRMGTDGEGVTTLVAGAGCPLRCRWCINGKLLSEVPAENVSADELLDRVKTDDLYFQVTGGGITFGGGESLLHVPFIRRFREICHPQWKIYAETSLSIPEENVILAADAVSSFIVDCKDMNEDIYRRYTCGDAKLMKRNLRLLLDLAGPGRIKVRVPLIPQFNTANDQEKSVAELKAMGIENIEIFDYIIREE
ncbi:MAG: radical SAM protein [Oscillospiraceae bacterium]|nr:radical SAM protein [Oscillospiraceae bacterium]